jgi:hypothetical protein
MAKSIIKKTISRKISTANFESLDISLEVEEQIVWETEEDRIAATAKLSEKLMDDFVATYNEAVTKIGVDRCIAVVTVTGGKSEPKSNNSVDFDF